MALIGCLDCPYPGEPDLSRCAACPLLAKRGPYVLPKELQNWLDEQAARRMPQALRMALVPPLPTRRLTPEREASYRAAAANAREAKAARHRATPVPAGR